MIRIIIILTIFLITNYISFPQWEKVYSINTNKENNLIYSIATIENKIYVGTIGQIFLSNDNGENWKDISKALPNELPKSLYVNSIAVKDDMVFAGLWEAGIYLSTNDGVSWEKMNNGLTSLYIRVIAINDDNIFVGTWDKGIFLSTDNGENWKEVNNGLPSSSINCITFNGTNIFAGTAGKGVFVSTDNGESWIEKNNGLTSYSTRSIAIRGENTYVSTDRGIFISDDYGENWRAINNGLIILKILNLIVSSDIIYSCSTQGIFISSDNGDNWIEANDGLDDVYIRRLAKNHIYIFAGTSYGNVYRAKLSDFGTSGFPAKNPFKDDIKISPNPATDYVEVTISNHTLKGVVEIARVYDVLGMCVITLPPAPLHSGEESKVRLDVSHLPAGVYFVQICSRVQRFVKL